MTVLIPMKLRLIDQKILPPGECKVVIYWINNDRERGQIFAIGLINRMNFLTDFDARQFISRTWWSRLYVKIRKSTEIISWILYIRFIWSLNIILCHVTPTQTQEIKHHTHLYYNWVKWRTDLYEAILYLYRHKGSGDEHIIRWIHH